MKNTEQSLSAFIQDENKHSFIVMQGRTFRKGPIMRGVGAFLLGTFFIFGFFNLTIKYGADVGILSLLLLGLIFLTGGALILFARDGVEINTRRMEIMEFVRFGLNWGSWKSIKKYPYITVIKLHKTVFYGSFVGKMAGDRDTYSRAEENDEFEVCLLNETHYKRMTMAISKNYDEARQMADVLSQRLGLQIVEFNPVRVSGRKSRRGGTHPRSA